MTISSKAAKSCPSDGRKQRHGKTAQKIKTCSSEQKEVCLALLKNAVDAGIVKGRDVHLGFNSTMKLVAAKRVSVVVSFRDTSSSILSTIKEAVHADNTPVPVVIFPKVSSEFAKVVGVKKLSCFGVSLPGGLEDQAEKSHDLEVALDKFRDNTISISGFNIDHFA